MSLVFLTESQLHSLVSGKNKSFMTRTINKQKRYGNIDIFEMIINTHDRIISISLGEGKADFRKDYHTDKWQHDYGYLTNVKECTDIVNEVALSIGI